jgi:hypothetical protein
MIISTQEPVCGAIYRTLSLVSGLRPANRCARLFGMLQAYFDDSKEDGEALIFAGYLAPASSWIGFSADWASLLTIRPEMRTHKMSAAHSQDRMERAMFHYRAIERANLIGIGCAIPIAPLQKVVNDMGLDAGWANPYLLAWRTVIAASFMGADELGFNEPIQFIFDQQADKVSVMKGWDYFYASASDGMKERIRGCPSFMDDEDVVPLQAADMIAWWARKQYISDKNNMRNLFPSNWTNGKDHPIMFVEMPEKSIRQQFEKDVAAAKAYLASPAFPVAPKQRA